MMVRRIVLSLCLALLAPLSPCRAQVPTGTSLQDILDSVSLFGGHEFDDTQSYQFKARLYLRGFPGLLNDCTEAEIIELYALTSLYFATCGVETPYTSFIFSSGHFELNHWRIETNWLSATKPCDGDWYGITCNAEGKVTEIALRDNWMTGGLPMELSLLTDLRDLDVFWNFLYNTGGEWLGDLQNIETLILGRNFWRASEDGFLDQLTNLSNLRVLEMSRSFMQETIPSEFGQLVKLRQLSLHSNTLIGTIPPELGDMKSLQIFEIEGNLIGGVMPSDVCENVAADLLIHLEADCERDIECSCCTCCGNLCLDVDHSLPPSVQTTPTPITPVEPAPTNPPTPVLVPATTIPTPAPVTTTAPPTPLPAAPMPTAAPIVTTAPTSVSTPPPTVAPTPVPATPIPTRQTAPPRTPSPTSPAPSANPSVSPIVTEFPTTNPTVSPVTDPTDFPTVVPTGTPTAGPALNLSEPVSVPTPFPTIQAQPTPAPTIPAPVSGLTPFPTIPAPTPIPTASPVFQPVPDQTPPPTMPPTAAPMPAPTPLPTPSPTFQPVPDQTPPPTPAPTFPPTQSPTPSPTNAPTQPPTPSPTFQPVPDQTPPPTPPPSPLPTNPPTFTPTPFPTNPPIFPLTPEPTDPPTPMPIVPPTPAPIFPPTPAPIDPPTPVPVSPIRQLLEPLLLVPGVFDDPSTYQARALAYLENDLSDKIDSQYISYFALACIYYASFGVPNDLTAAADIDDDVAASLGWISSTGWVTDSNYCSWFGITCDFIGRVQRIGLDNNRMFGLFAPEVQYLASSLNELELFNNQFLKTDGVAGNSWIAEMTELQDLYVGSTGFTFDGIPTYFGSLPNIVEVDVSDTGYSNGPIPAAAFANNPTLQYIDLSQNQYTTTIPSTVTTHPGLDSVYVDNSQFVGVQQTLDFAVGMPLIFELWMDLTPLSGSIPTGFGTLSNLASVSLTFCGLTGSVPSELGNLGNSLTRLWLYQNQLSGTIPSELGNLSRIAFLLLEGNKFVGSVPQEICNNRDTNQGLLSDLGTDCEAGNPFEVSCTCCSCCGPVECGDFV